MARQLGLRRGGRAAPRGEPGGAPDRARGRPDRSRGAAGDPAAPGAELRQARAPARVHRGRPRPDHPRGEVALGRRTRAERRRWSGCGPGRWPPQRGLVLSPVTADNLGRHAPPFRCPGRPRRAEALLEMLSSGAGLVPVWEALELAGCIVRWIPCWEPIRARPQHNPIHRYTVDRHSVQTVVEAQRHLTQVERPDLLLLAALLPRHRQAARRRPASTPRSAHRSPGRRCWPWG